MCKMMEESKVKSLREEKGKVYLIGKKGKYGVFEVVRKILVCGWVRGCWEVVDGKLRVWEWL